jgi:uncharacterized protein
VDRLFLDATVLFAAAYRADAGLRRLWSLPDVQLFSSRYACAEAQANLLPRDPSGRPLEAEGVRIEKLDRLLHLLRRVTVVVDSGEPTLPEGVVLPEKDAPILRGAIDSRVTHLLTADRAHFGRYFGQTVAGVLILAPGDYLRSRAGPA